MERMRILILCSLLLAVSCSIMLAENIAIGEMGGTYSCSPAYSSATAERLFDGNVGSNIALLVNRPEVYVIREWEQTAVIDNVQLRLRAASGALDFEILVWEYGMWKTVASITDNEEGTVDIPLGGIKTRKIMYRPSRFVDVSYHHVWEILVEGSLEETFVPQPEEFTAEKRANEVSLSWEAPLETKEGAQATGYNVLRADVVDGSYENWQTIATGVTASSWSGTADFSQSAAYSVVAVDKWGHFSEMAAPVVIKAEATITGRVVDEEAQPISSANVSIKALGLSTYTGSDGTFSLPNVPHGIVELEVSKAGYIRELRPVVLTEAGLANLIFTLQSGAELPGAPAFLTATPQPGKVSFEWVSPGESHLGPLKYNLYRSETPGVKYGQLAPLATELSSTSWIDTTTIPGKVYYYAVTAVSVTSHESDFSNEVKAICQSQEVPVLVEPQQHAVIVNNYVVMRWEPLSGTSHYYVEYARSPLFSEEQTHSRTIRTGTQLVDLGLSEGNWYWRVQAFFADGTASGFSQTSSFSVVNTTSSDTPEIAFFDLWPKTVGKEPYVNIHYILNSADLAATVRVYDLTGRCVKTFFVDYPALAGHHEFSWDGRGDNGLLLKNGLYLMQFIAAKPGQRFEVRKKIIVMN